MRDHAEWPCVEQYEPRHQTASARIGDPPPAPLAASAKSPHHILIRPPSIRRASGSRFQSPWPERDQRSCLRWLLASCPAVACPGLVARLVIDNSKGVSPQLCLKETQLRYYRPLNEAGRFSRMAVMPS